MTFDDFCNNVETWSEARGIYAHSTALAQALKAVSEVGELADAVIKGDEAALIDAIGDVAVCIVNVAKMAELPVDHLYKYREEVEGAQTYSTTAEACASVANRVGGLALNASGRCESHDAVDALCALLDMCDTEQLLFTGCCEAAWDEIKDRKGRMVPGGAFVKEGV